MHEDIYNPGYSQEPGKGVLIAGTCLALLLSGAIWLNLFSGDKPVFERSAVAPAPVMITEQDGLAQQQITKNVVGEVKVNHGPVAAAGNKFPAASVSVNIPQGQAAPSFEDPLAQLILQTSSTDNVLASPQAELSQTNLVLLAQQELSALGLYEGLIDGLPGADTRDAIRKYQALNALPVTGVITQPVIDHIQLANRVNDAGKASPRLHQVQQALSRLGYSPGEIDGRPSAQTRQAIEAFEADRGWPITGKLSDAMLLELVDDTGVAGLSNQ
ncbi:MAG: peptidoglycan-binding domain-containing protein [Anderseniella sp.]